MCLILAAVIVMPSGSMADDGPKKALRGNDYSKGAGPGGNGPKEGGQFDPAKAAEVKKRILEERNKRMKEELKLTDEKAAKLFTVLTKYDAIIDEDIRSGMKFKDEVSAALKSGNISEEKAAEIVKKLAEREKSVCDTRQKKHDEIKAILTSKEMLKFMIMEKRFMQRMKEFADKRGEAGEGPGAGRGPEGDREGRRPPAAGGPKGGAKPPMGGGPQGGGGGDFLKPPRGW